MHWSRRDWTKINVVLQVDENAPMPMGAAVLGDEVVHEVDGQHRFGSSCQGACEATNAGSKLNDSLASNIPKHSQHLQAKPPQQWKIANNARLVQGFGAFSR